MTWKTWNWPRIGDVSRTVIAAGLVFFFGLWGGLAAILMMLLWWVPVAWVDGWRRGETRSRAFHARDVNVTHLGRYGPGRQI